eukprot:m.219796 g.219796  ORF g.219796 m.219796 type:complete len:274 (-) comp25761_c1_seq3:265-1086(-)
MPPKDKSAPAQGGSPDVGSISEDPAAGADKNVAEHTASVKWAGLLDKKAPQQVITQPDPDKFDQVYHIKGLLSKAECTRFIEAQEKEGYGFTNYNKKYRGNLRLINDDPSLAAALYPRLAGVIPTDIVDESSPSSVWRPVGLNPRFRCSKYTPGDVFGAHVDAAYAESVDVQSLFTVNIYTSTVATRGETRFFHSGREGGGLAFACDAVAGDAVVFRQPPGRAYRHDGAGFPDGVKYLLRTDVMVILISILSRLAPTLPWLPFCEAKIPISCC